MARHNQWHVSGWPAILIAPVVAPLALIARAFGFVSDTPAELSASDVAQYLDNFLCDRGQPFDWDDFTSIDLSDPILDAIREEAASIPLPVDAIGQAKLVSLLEKARALSDVG